MPQQHRPFVDILTGFLGAGKTTLLNALLTDPAWAGTAVVVNEIGAVGLDHLLVVEERENVALLAGGCLCCAIVDSLPETLLDLCQRSASGDIPAFRRIVIETTGLADPGSIAGVIRHSSLIAHFLALGSVITLVDAAVGEACLSEYTEAAAQVALADRIVLTKLDLVDDAKPLIARVEGINPLAETITIADVRADPALLLRPVAHDRSPVANPRHGSHTPGLATHHVAVDAPVTRSGLDAWTRALSLRLGDRLLRCKGIVPTGQGAILVQGVRSRFTFERTAHAPLGLTVIGRDISPDELTRDLALLHADEGTQFDLS